MMRKKVLIVEDERIIAEDIKSCLLNFDYEVLEIVSNGEDAIVSTALLKPDLILMDIKIEGSLDGIQTAKRILKSHDLPIVYLTANADEATVERAKETKPYGYLTKPFEEAELYATLQVAYYKYESEKALKKSEERFRTLIEENTDGIVVVDEKGIIRFVNTAAVILFEKEKVDLLFKKYGYPISNKAFTEIDILLNSGKKRIVESHVVETEWEGERAFLATLRDITKRKKAEEDLQNSNEKLRRLMEETVNGLMSAVEMRDPYTAGHQRRVAELATAIGDELRLNTDKLDGLRIAALIHDIGKIHVPSEILSKPGKLTDIEFTIMESHAQAGYDVLKSIDFPWPIAKTVLQHHEKMNGSSYPNGLFGEEIILEARILCVADVVEAMSSHRPYRPALGLDKAVEEITKNKGILYDPVIVDACVEVIKDKHFKFGQKTLN
ncbi:MAG: histidine kinase [Candidatus Cloacimonadota bacterium]|nr:MAG: histidine kinase [Candidatus Cloacimonadota bacterium]RLC51912.1 MAG: histidine kinase [Candidatus Cloacimonadota bacterium]